MNKTEIKMSETLYTKTHLIFRYKIDDKKHIDLKLNKKQAEAFQYIINEWLNDLSKRDDEFIP